MCAGTAVTQTREHYRVRCRSHHSYLLYSSKACLAAGRDLPIGMDAISRTFYTI